MRHLIFPTVAQADAFVQDLLSQGVIQPEMGQTSFQRRTAAGSMGGTGMGTTTTQTSAATATTTEYVDGGGDGQDMAGGALKGTALGAVAGVAAGAVVAATGGLAAVPVLLGMGALGSGIGAAAGTADAAVHGDGMETRVAGSGEAAGTRSYEDRYEFEDTHYNDMQSTVDAGGRAIAIEDDVPMDVVEAAMARHGGRFVNR
ncbi:hypothetical protein L1280_001382 [Deinococcus sp. HSC-46F16]|uniref:hypothetical protein n=1 Tax=Deinococcus sp. HSC-46F16 TaxID=2910968 RepID=UPI00209E0458|nr:hypothetical protein [Deinococcus sp. HSC-46F16]MCP2014245.1 hypothetical protein [Deinococcus sp. HSC-46F16]